MNHVQVTTHFSIYLNAYNRFTFSCNKVKDWLLFMRIRWMIVSLLLHIGHVEDLPQGLITAIIHLHQICSREAVVVLLLGYLGWRGRENNTSNPACNCKWVLRQHLANTEGLFCWLLPLGTQRGAFRLVRPHLQASSEWRKLWTRWSWYALAGHTSPPSGQPALPLVITQWFVLFSPTLLWRK